MRFPHPAQITPQSLSNFNGKARDFAPRDEGSGGPDGIVIDLQLITDSQYQSEYVAPVLLGSAQSKFYLQVDTGSADLWVTSTACSSSLCSLVGNNKYNPSGSQATGLDLTLPYAEGEADGPVVWDVVQLGGYSIDKQALIAASNVEDEPLASNFNGVLGLAPPANSLIAYNIPPTTSNLPDGATVGSNIFSISPVSTAPGARFFSLALERPGSDRVPSVLGIGRHPSALVPDPSKIQYDTILSTSVNGPEWWQVSVQGINVYTNNERKPVSLPASASGASVPNAVLDSGVPLIITSTTIANGIYGAMGISPASDGNYYISCTTPINITIQLDNRTELPIHPLDLSYYPPSDASSDTCIGVIQTPSQFPGLNLGTTDMILGVPFLRNTYTVMAYDPPYANGSFPPASSIPSALDIARPRLGLMNLTDPVIAAEEFHQVRVLKQPLDKSVAAAPSHSKGLSVGVEVLIALLGFFGLCFVLFGARWAYMKRKYAHERVPTGPVDGKDGAYVNELGYHLKPMGTQSSGPSEDELRQRRFEAYKRRHMSSTYTDDTGITYVEPHTPEPKVADEFGLYKRSETLGSPGDGGFFDQWGDTLVDSRPTSRIENSDLLSPPPRTARRSDYSPRSVHRRTLSGGPGVEVPLLGHGHGRSDSNPRDSEDITELGTLDRPQSMAGIGTATRSRRMGGSPLATPLDEHPPRLRSSHESRGSISSPHSLVPVPPVAIVSAQAPLFDASHNNSGVSNLGHEP